METRLASGCHYHAWTRFNSSFHTQINKLARERVESGLTFAGFLVFHCPLKKDAVETIRMLADASHRVGDVIILLP